MGEKMVLPKIIYKGCDNPKKYLEEQFKDIPKPVELPKTYEEVKEILRKQDNYEIPRPEPHAWLSPFWEEHKRLLLEQTRIDDICREKTEKYNSMNLVDMVHDMSGVHTYGFYTEADISNAEHILGVRFAEDYKECLYNFGKLDLYRLRLCNLFDEEGVIDGTQSYRQLPTFHKKYYFVCGIRSEHICSVAYFQDTDGYVYGLNRNWEMSPLYPSWKDLLMVLWMCFVEGDL